MTEREDSDTWDLIICKTRLRIPSLSLRESLVHGKILKLERWPLEVSLLADFDTLMVLLRVNFDLLMASPLVTLDEWQAKLEVEVRTKRLLVG